MSASQTTQRILALSILPTVLVFGIAYLSLVDYEQQAKEVIAAQQRTVVRALGVELDNKLTRARDLLVSVSRMVPVEALNNGEAAQRFLDDHAELRALFDNDLALLTPRGVLIAESPPLTNRRGLDLSDREYIKRTATDLKPYISEPAVTTPAHKHPVVVFTAPILDQAGRLTAVLAGSVDLLGHDFLGSLAESAIGAGGHFCLINKQGLIVVHHDSDRVLTLMAPGQNPALDRALQEGFEGSAETATGSDSPVLASFQHLTANPNWVLNASYPLDEAYAPIYRMRERVLWASAVGGLLILLASTLVVRHFTAPLRRLATDLQGLALRNGSARLAEPGRGEEIRDLARSFNHLLDVLDDQKHALQQREQQYRIVADFSTHLAFWRAPDGAIRWVAPNCLDLTGYSDSDFYHDSGLLDRIVHPEDRSVWLAHWEEVRAGARARCGPLEFRFLKQDGTLRWTSHTCQPVVDSAGAFLGIRGCNADITEKKQTDRALCESEARLAEAIRIAQLGSWHLNLQSGEFTVSREHLDMMGYGVTVPPERLILPVTEYIETFVHPGDHASMAERYRFAIEHGRDPEYRDSFDYQLLHRDGSVHSVSVSARALPERPGVIHGVTQDITERKEVERALAELSRWHEQILNSAGEGILGLSGDGAHVFANPAAARMLGFQNPADLIGQKSHPLWHHSHGDGSPFPDAECPILDSLRDGKVRQVDDEVFWRKDGTSFPADYTSTPMYEGERIIGAVIVFEDVTERKRAEEALRESQERLRAVIDNEPECVKLLDRDGRVMEMNPAGLAMLQADASQVIGKLLTDVVLPEYHSAFAALNARVFEGHSGILELEAVGLEGRRLWLETHAVPLRGAHGETLALLAVTRDITEQKRIEEKLEHDALHDGLTGLPNRVLFTDRLQQCLERTKQKQNYAFAVLFLDLDRFKVVNDSLGHLVGDRLLIDIARRLERCVRPMDTVARLGGDEFALLLDDTIDPTEPTRVAERIERALAKPFKNGAHEVFSSASIGIAVSRMGYQHPEEIMRDADTAMYRAKLGGKSRFQMFDAAMHLRATQALRMETDLRYALAREQLRVYYQPILETRSGAIACLEALLRWQHPQRGLVLPAEFIPVAEETGLILPIGAWVLRTACQALGSWKEQFPQHLHLSVAVNLSTRQFLQADLGTTIRTSLEDSGLPGQSLKIEVTETMLMENVDIAAEVLLDLRSAGVRVCMDDFGTGYSSLSRLHGLPIDTLKVDKSFVGRMDTGGNNLELVRGIVGLGHNLGMHVVAEGVETREQLELLQDLDCEYAQGFFIGEPLPAEEVGPLLALAPATEACPERRGGP